MIRGLLRAIVKIIKTLIGVIFTIILIGICAYVDARYIEPKLLTVKEQEITTDKLSLTQPLRVVHFSDVHLGNDYTMYDFKKVINKINSLNPDVIIFSGDLIDDNKTFSDEDETGSLLSELHAVYGKYAVYGNHDHGGNGTKRYARIMEKGGFQLLVNTADTIQLEKSQKMSIVGVDDIILGHPDFKAAFTETDDAQFKLFISHAPDVAEYVKGKGVDLQLSGHSHGGQVRFPIVGAPFTVPYGTQYVKGLYEVPENDGMLIYVNSGIGTSKLPYRFFNLPEITLLLIQSSK